MKPEDIENLAAIFDTIINSPSQAVQNAFRNLTVLASLSHESDENIPGPFTQLFSRMESLEYEIRTLRREVQVHNNSGYTMDDSTMVNLGGLSGGISITAPNYSYGNTDTITLSGLDTIDLSGITLK